ncbi:hypothetical protein RGQ29_022369 [Quercus rubra]|uniref:ATP-dependent Clp protease proteolytic subunit n=1 Tax=Quercus rubra TaxID=3512 RepID=A0AAN7F355_QUERU|nr:hypothetical protein RGQ29_022369 [Quercus rubra]
MPIGVPKVPFQSPGEEDASWVDIWCDLSDILEVDSDLSNQIIGLMVYLSLEDDSKDLYLFINSLGGWVILEVAIYDTMQFVQPNVQTICMGLAASIGSFLLVGGEITKRYIIKVMIHQPASSFYEAPTGEFILEAEEMMKLRETITRVYVQRTGTPLWVVFEDMEIDVFMLATESQAHGIVDHVGVE